jgi:chorismate mutase/prephenate dehydratase
LEKKEKLKSDIERIDSEILDLLNQRINCTARIDGVTYTPSDEYKMYKKLLEKNSGRLKEDSLKAIFREILSTTSNFRKKLRIAFLGPQGTFTHQAALNKFGASADYNPISSIGDVFDEVVKERFDFGVVPIENTTGGAVTHTLDMFMDHDLKICSEITLPIRHNLLAGSKNTEIKEIYSHPQSFSQCRRWLYMNFPNAKLIDVESTSAAAKIARTKENSAAIASKLAATLYHLRIINKEIEDLSNNMTRFLIIGTQVSNPTGNDKTSILFSLKNRVGALYDALEVFKRYSVNLSKIESRPSKTGNWEYCFFVDLDGHFRDNFIKEALKEIKGHCNLFKILGSYSKEI